MTVDVGPTGITSDVCSAAAVPTPDWRYVLQGVDGSHLVAAAAGNVLNRVRRSSGDQNTGAAVALDSGLLELRGVDGAVVDRDSARAVVAHVDEASRCHLAVTLCGHPPLNYQADTSAAELFARELRTGHVVIDDVIDDKFPVLPNERLFL